MVIATFFKKNIYLLPLFSKQTNNGNGNRYRNLNNGKGLFQSISRTAQVKKKQLVAKHLNVPKINPNVTKFAFYCIFTIHLSKASGCHCQGTHVTLAFEVPLKNTIPSLPAVSYVYRADLSSSLQLFTPSKMEFEFF